MTSLCGKTKQKWEGPEHWFKFQIKQEQAELIYNSTGIKDHAEYIQKLKEFGWISETTSIDVSTELKDQKWKELRDAGLFEGNPQKNWGPKKMK